MGWQKRRNGRTYYYKSIRVGGKVSTRYEGSGEFARLLAQLDAVEARIRRIDRLNRRLVVEEEREFTRYCRGVEAVFRGSLMNAGYHQHERSEWRRRRPMSEATGTELQPIEAPSTVPRVYTSKEVHEIAARASEGDRSTLGDIQAILAGPKRASLLRCLGNPAYYLRDSLIRGIAGKDLFIHAAMEARAEELEAELTPSNPTPIDRLLAERAVVTWFAVHVAEKIEIDGRSRDIAPQMRELQQRRVERSNARFLASVKALETSQRLKGGATTVSMSRTEKLTLKQD